MQHGIFGNENVSMQAEILYSEFINHNWTMVKCKLLNAKKIKIHSSTTTTTI